MKLTRLGILISIIVLAVSCSKPPKIGKSGGGPSVGGENRLLKDFLHHVYPHLLPIYMSRL